jgi:hypothetical protein
MEISVANVNSDIILTMGEIPRFRHIISHLFMVELLVTTAIATSAGSGHE